MKRSSRTTVVSKAFRVVDSETRKDIRDRRLLALEADNYNEVEQENNEEDFDADEEENTGKRRKGGSSSKSSTQSKWSKRPHKSFERILFEQGYNPNPVLGDENYLSITSAPPVTRCVPFCSVCGYIGHYTCTRCGMRYCSNRCQNNHKETRCMKLSM